MTLIIKKASRQQKKLRINFSASSGSGKTLGALRVGYGITGDWGKICVIDSEEGSASLYANNDKWKTGEFNTISLTAPYTPEKYIEAISMAEIDHDVVIIDSITHEWNGPGGCLEIHSKLGGKFQDWSKVTPRHNAFVDAIIRSKAHIFCTVRRKEDHIMERGQTGMTVRKAGLKEVTRDGKRLLTSL